MARPKKNKAATVTKAAESVSSITSNGVTVNIGKAEKAANTVTILFRSRFSQTFNLRDGRSVTLLGNAVNLAGANHAAPLPVGGYSVNVVDADLWKAVKAEFGAAFRPWFEDEKIIESESEKKAVDTAMDNADDDAGNNPIDTKTDRRLGTGEANVND